VRELAMVLAALLMAPTGRPRAANLGARELAVLGQVLGKSTLNSVQRRLGTAETWPGPGEHASETRLCYLLGSGTDRAILEFASDSEFGGGSEHRVTDIRLYSGGATAARQGKCSATALTPKDAVSRSGIRLGLRESRVIRTLWNPAERTSDRPVFSSCVKGPMLPSSPEYARWWGRRPECFFDGSGAVSEPYSDVCTTVAIGLKNGVTSSVELHRIESVC
jgi:hypothetical protein